MALTKIVRSEKAPRTGEYASNPERKKTPCISGLAGVKFLLKKERVFFLSGFCPPSIRAVWRGFNVDSVLPKLFFWGFGFGKTETEFPARRNGSGE